MINWDKDRENNFRDVVEDQFDLEFFDLGLELSCPEGFTELPFQDGEYSFNYVSLMVTDQVK